MRLSKPQLEARLALVEAAGTRDSLLDMWGEVYDRPLPKNISLRLMKLAIAYQLQVKALGGKARHAPLPARGGAERSIRAEATGG